MRKVHFAHGERTHVVKEEYLPFKAQVLRTLCHSLVADKDACGSDAEDVIDAGLGHLLVQGHVEAARTDTSHEGRYRRRRLLHIDKHRLLGIAFREKERTCSSC